MTKKITLKQRARIFQALKKAGHWYIVDIVNWEHPANKIPNCVAIMFDGFIQCKFEMLKDGWLRLAEFNSRYLKGFPELNTRMTVEDISNVIVANPHIGYDGKPCGAAISLKRAVGILQQKKKPFDAGVL